MKTCLIIEDSSLIRELAVRILSELSVEAREAPTAAAAIEECRRNKPDVVLLDWDLPSLGALDFLRGVAELPAEQRPAVVLCATENDPQQFTLAKAAGAAHHMLKPFDKQSIAEKLAELGVIDAAPAAPKTAQAS